MTNTRQEKLEQLKSFITFEDIIALAIARSGKEKFSAKTEHWSKAMKKIKDRFSDQIPELKEIYFSERPPLAPQSDQVYQVFTTLARSGEISLPNPQYREITVHEAQRNLIEKAIGKSLCKYDTFMNSITMILEDELAVR
jgi:hypothetical protein